MFLAGAIHFVDSKYAYVESSVCILAISWYRRNLVHLDLLEVWYLWRKGNIIPVGLFRLQSYEYAL